MTTRQVLQKARAILITKGWIQHRLKSDYGFCALGAIQEATRSGRFKKPLGILDARMKAKTQLRKIISRGTHISGYSIDQWNDEDGRTKEQILRAFAKAAR